MRRGLVVAFLVATATGCAGSRAHLQPERQWDGDPLYVQTPGGPPNHSLDLPDGGVDQIEQSIAPLIRKARATYPDAKRRYLAGLPKYEHFFVTARLRDESGRTELSFVLVRGIARDVISGQIASDPALVLGFRRHDHFDLKESDLVDWIITKPDGSEEGDLVGKFLDPREP